MNLTAEALKRKSFKETTSLPRFIQTAEEDMQLQSLSSNSPSKKIEIKDDTFDSYLYVNDNENVTFIGPHNAIESSIA